MSTKIIACRVPFKCPMPTSALVWKEAVATTPGRTLAGPLNKIIGPERVPVQPGTFTVRLLIMISGSMGPIVKEFISEYRPLTLYVHTKLF
jgi:hypothetical protein